MHSSSLYAGMKLECQTKNGLEEEMNLTASSIELGIGVRILDCDHREMSETFSELRTALVKDEDRSRTLALLRKMSNFTLLHFALEDGMMAATKYPGMALHRLNHQRMATQIKAFVSRFSHGSATMNEKSLRLLAESHTAHIENDDLDYGFWLNGSPDADSVRS
jgi:hemerythrin